MLMIPLNKYQTFSKMQLIPAGDWCYSAMLAESVYPMYKVHAASCGYHTPPFQSLPINAGTIGHSHMSRSEHGLADAIIPSPTNQLTETSPEPPCYYVPAHLTSSFHLLNVSHHLLPRLKYYSPKNSPNESTTPQMPTWAPLAPS